jgi:hypothetical protein
MNGPAQTRPRRKLVFALIALAAVIGFLAVFAVWAKRQLLETQTWTDTSTKLLENDDIRTVVSGYMVDTLFSEVDVQAEIKQALPPRAAPAAGPIAGAIRQLADNLAGKALQRPRVQQLWEQANESAHHTLLDVVEHGGSEDVTLDLGTIVNQLGEQVGVSNAASKLPANAGQIVILKNDQLAAAQKAVDLLQTLAWALTAVALLLFALAIYLAAGWRREALRSVGFAFIGIGIVVLVARGIAGNYVTGQLASTASVEPAIDATWSIGTSVLADIGGGMLFYGIVIVIGAWLAGPTGVGRAVRRELAPVLARRGTAYAALAALLLLLFWWSPTPGFQRLLVSILLILLFVIGLEALRRQAIRDFPEQTWEAGTQRWRETGRSLFQRRGGGGQSTSGRPHGGG